MFVRPIHRLAKIDFDPVIATLHIKSAEHARQIAETCATVIDRCRKVQEVLRQRFPFPSV
jgi:hypothetical protein